jgi:hypothetical protein
MLGEQPQADAAIPSSSGKRHMPFAAVTPNSARCPAARWPTWSLPNQQGPVRCRIAIDCCTTIFLGTTRIVGPETASQIHSASIAPLLPGIWFRTRTATVTSIVRGGSQPLFGDHGSTLIRFAEHLIVAVEITGLLVELPSLGLVHGRETLAAEAAAADAAGPSAQSAAFPGDEKPAFGRAEESGILPLEIALAVARDIAEPLRG